MIETYFAAPHVLDRMRSGPMATYVGALADELRSQGYSRKSIRRQLRDTDSFGWWLSEQDLAVASITDEVVSRYVGGLHRSSRQGCAKGYRPHNARGLPRLLDLLRRSGVLSSVIPSRPVGDSRLRDFDHYLEQVRGLASTTRAGYLHEARGFLQHVFGDATPEWPQISPEHVASYIAGRAAQLSLTCRRDPITPLRAFLRYLTGEGLLSASLEYAIPRIRQWKHATLPPALSEEDLAKVLAAPCDRSVKGLRNRAILLLLARLGLRAGEILRLCLEDIDWRKGHLLVRAGKNRRERVLPLPEEVGEALAAYLKDGRPSGNQRPVFLSLCPPYCPLRNSQAVSMVATHALKDAAVSTPRPGAYLFRHTVATHMVCRGATFKSVSDVLGHRTLSVTGVYAKLDLTALAKWRCRGREVRSEQRHVTVAPGSLSRTAPLAGIRNIRTRACVARLRRLPGDERPAGSDSRCNCRGLGAASLRPVLPHRRRHPSPHGPRLPRSLEGIRAGNRDPATRTRGRTKPSSSAALLNGTNAPHHGSGEPGSFQQITFRTVIGLLASTGLRIGEALRLTLDQAHLDHDPPYLEIRDTKFHKSRLVPLHPTAAAKLKKYLVERQQHVQAQAAKTFFINDHGRPLRYHPVREAILQAQTHAGIVREEGPGRQGPTLHALRHAFAVERLLAWYRAGADVRALLPNLSVYLGHLGMVETYRYLSATPELLTIAGERFGQYAHEGGRE